MPTVRPLPRALPHWLGGLTHPLPTNFREFWPSRAIREHPTALGWERGRKFLQVRKKSAGRELVCMLVSRFFQNPIQNLFSEIQSARQSPPSRAGVQSGAPGYMRKQKPGLVERLVWADAPLQPPRCLWCCGGGPGWRYPKGGPAAALGYSLPPYLFHIRMIFTAWSFVQRWCFGPAAGDS